MPPWKKGQSGNPRGRPRDGASLAARLAKAVDARFDEVVQRLLELSCDPHDNPMVRHQSIRTTLESCRLLGRHVDINVDQGGERPTRVVIEL